jgi:hypothetical protein
MVAMQKIVQMTLVKILIFVILSTQDLIHPFPRDPIKIDEKYSIKNVLDNHKNTLHLSIHF